ncbi:hypothetical protein CONCODRAFT_4897 [Conidiobolus coronatus NRRL 28638]|uniref:Zn(2)-C6 fungal-type domain-containing protein n=1 Tax=Conidiobolus coronatus (strain ATCC 28846 / CBS 209.66 / NRRL 28638) TaxID=796925 RepID=A0A137PBF0_CONC2|nr:hypothetical protein CONCODRAFT_4897 [Conidiobolus coronatus NRRL 28638]|eukprot:KXN72261.1 hypothetical protein CONCODRAFT_4897 [Conidiobolus coronatus NRRL 28638]
MRPKVQQNCVECKRRKIKCSRAQPCSNCLKSGVFCFYINKKQISIEADESRSKTQDLTRYQVLRNLKLEEKWLKLVFKVEMVINWCSEDPRLVHLVVSY